jgi:hypothetical protein
MNTTYRPYFSEWADANIVVDSGPRAGTVLTLSHWPSSPTPPCFLADTSAESVFLLLRDQEIPCAKYVTASHYDVDALISLFAWLHPNIFMKSHDFWINVAYAGDFECFPESKTRMLARTLDSLGDPSVSPWGSLLTSLGKAEQHVFLFEEILPTLSNWPDILKKYPDLWNPGENLYHMTELFLRTCNVRHVPEIDISIISSDRLPVGEDIDADPYSGLDPYAVNEVANGSLIIMAFENSIRIVQRYESWVRYVSRPIRYRRDLSPLSKWLSEQDNAAWSYGGIQAVTPCLMPVNGRTSLPIKWLIEQICAYNASAPPGWHPNLEMTLPGHQMGQPSHSNFEQS